MPSRDTQHASPHATDRPRESTHVQSVERAAALLRAVAAASGPAATATALAQTVGLNRTTTWRILATLEQQRLVSHDRETGSYSLGIGLIDLAGQAGGALARSARAVLQRVAAAPARRPHWRCSATASLTYVTQVDAGVVVSVASAGPAGLDARRHRPARRCWRSPTRATSGAPEPRREAAGCPGAPPRRRSSRCLGSRRSSRGPVLHGYRRVPGRVRGDRLGRLRARARLVGPPRRRSSASGVPPTGSPPRPLRRASAICGGGCRRARRPSSGAVGTCAGRR